MGKSSSSPTRRDPVRDRNFFVKASKPASGADFGVANAFMWRIGPGPVDMMANSAPMIPFRQAQARGRTSRSLCGPLQALSATV